MLSLSIPKVIYAAGKMSRLRPLSVRHSGLFRSCSSRILAVIDINEEFHYVVNQCWKLLSLGLLAGVTPGTLPKQ
jgi:hypothetical protein